MTVTTTVGVPMDATILVEYFDRLVGRFFKILPLRENEDASLPAYIRSLTLEMVGFYELIQELRADLDYVGLIATLQYLRTHPDSSVDEVRKCVFSAISVCNDLRDHYAETTEPGEEVCGDEPMGDL